MSQIDTRGSGPPGMRWCALCASEYVPGVRECVECLVPLVDAPPLTPDEVGDEDGDQLAYDLDELDAAGRLSIDRDLAGRGVVHAWDGATLVVAPWDEAEVDAILGGDDDGDGHDHDHDGHDHDHDDDDHDDDEQLVYDIADWDAERRAELAERLDAAGLAYAFDEHGDLVVLAADEDAVDELVDAVDHPDQLPEESDAPGALDAVETVGSLFVAADRLVHDPTDTEGVVGAADAARALSTMAAPFGFAPPFWDDLVARSQELRRLLETDAELVDDEAVVAAATALRAALRPYV